MIKLRRAWRKWQNRNHDERRLAELKQQLVQLKADAYDMRHWPEPVRKRMDGQVERLKAQIAMMEAKAHPID